MYSINFRYLFHLLRYQIGCLTLLCMLPAGFCHGQERYMNLPDHDNKPYYFGISLGYNNAFYKLEHDPKFLQDDSIMLVEPLKSAGFNMGLLANLQLNQRFDLRLNPTLIFAEKNLRYGLKDSTKETQNIESILLSFPLQVKFKSDRIGNFRIYTIAGVKADYDLASKARARRAEEIVKLHPFNWGYEAGLGFEFYFPNFIFSPEIKLSNGFGNIQVKEPGNLHSSVIERLISRMVIISIHLEG